MKALAVSVLSLAVLAAAPAQARVADPFPLGPRTSLYPFGAVAQDPSGVRGDAIHMPFGHIYGIRDIQCGENTGRPGDLNCDFGAGSAQHRGDIILNWDVGRCVKIYDGRKGLKASICPKVTTFYGKVRFRK